VEINGCGEYTPSCDAGAVTFLIEVNAVIKPLCSQDSPYIHWLTTERRLWPLIELAGTFMLVVLLLNGAAWLR
jgi:hypothetical protein